MTISLSLLHSFSVRFSGQSCFYFSSPSSFSNYLRGRTPHIIVMLSCHLCSTTYPLGVMMHLLLLIPVNPAVKNEEGLGIQGMAGTSGPGCMSRDAICHIVTSSESERGPRPRVLMIDDPRIYCSLLFLPNVCSCPCPRSITMQDPLITILSVPMLRDSTEQRTKRTRVQCIQSNTSSGSPRLPGI